MSKLSLNFISCAVEFRIFDAKIFMARHSPFSLKKTSLDRFLDLSSVLLLVWMWVLVAWSYQKLPETIAIHFNVLGEADGFGNKTTLFVLPLITLFMWLLITILSRYPHIFNYAVKITEENRMRQYTMAVRFLRWLKLIVIIIFFLILVAVISEANTNKLHNIAWLIMFIPIITFVPLGIYISKSVRNK